MAPFPINIKHSAGKKYELHPGRHLLFLSYEPGIMHDNNFIILLKSIQIGQFYAYKRIMTLTLKGKKKDLQ